MRDGRGGREEGVEWWSGYELSDRFFIPPGIDLDCTGGAFPGWCREKNGCFKTQSIDGLMCCGLMSRSMRCSALGERLV